MSHTHSEPFDIILAGGGAAGCVVAGRLAAADSSLRILIIEAGKHTLDVATHRQPARFFRNLLSGGDTFTFHVAKPSKALGDRPCIIPAGKCMGGGSSVNFMMYTRAQPSDYDEWAAQGNPGWAAKDLIPLSNKAETFSGPEDVSKKHGHSGPIRVSSARIQTSIGKHFLSTVAAYGRGREYKADTNDLDAQSVNVYSPWFQYVSNENGTRSDTAHHYVYNQASNKNLQILARCRVKKVIFEGTRAVGVEYISHDDSAEDKTKVLVAHAKLVVLSAGAFGTPAILERSGIGASQLLKAHDIQQVVDLPGVGENYLDHNLVILTYHTTQDEVTLDEVFSGTEEIVKPHADIWLSNGTGLIAHNGIEAGIKLRPSTKDLETLGPTFTKRWQEFFANHPDRPVMWVGALAAYTGANPSAVGTTRRRYYSVGYYTEYPAAAGRVHITSQDPYTPLAVEPGYLEPEEDVAVLRWSYKWARELARRMECYRGEFVPDHPNFPAGSDAACQEATGPVPVSAPDIVYTKEDDEAIDLFHRATVSTTWHSLGTCAMKPQAQRGVVDAKLNVYGVQNLKIADLSICPSNVGSNTYNSALVVGEKAAVIIAEELGIKGVLAA
ncbi:GMC oxidoreductase-domain-containing protein [Mycena rebaudengoi]|nr:GMC oxidoreductase-domain-containing protein [Mycena rebaudengoi]